MECRLSVRVAVSKFLLVLVLVLFLTASRADDTVVLVTSTDSPVSGVSSLDIRKAYLGIAVPVSGNTLRPFRRGEDERLNRIFLQSVIAMSLKSYERRLLSMMLKFGTPRPVEVDSHEELVQRLTRNRYGIAYMWKADADADARVKIIRVLWQER